MSTSNNVTKLVFVLMTLLCVVVAVLYTFFAARTPELVVGDLAFAPIVQSPSTAAFVLPPDDPARGSHELAARRPAKPHLVALNLRDAGDLGKVALSPLDAVDGPRTATSLRCETIYFAAGRGICLTREIQWFSARTVATVVDANFQPLSTVRTDGIPSRARISPDGRYAAFTVFVTGHSYADTQMSTATLLLDTATGASLGNLEEFRVIRDGKVIQSPDFNYWGVTFQQDSNFFYATLRTGGVNYLVHGDIKARTVTTKYKGVECPSLSPDETRIAFKKLISRANWRLTVLDLTTFEETSLAEAKSVDDQAEWLDNGHVLYTLPDPAAPPPGRSVMAVSADGTGEAKVFARGAASPSVVR